MGRLPRRQREDAARNGLDDIGVMKTAELCDKTSEPVNFAHQKVAMISEKRAKGTDISVLPQQDDDDDNTDG